MKLVNPRDAKGDGDSRRGWSTLELLLAAALGITLVLAGGYLFTTQVRGYLDIRDQAKIQGGMKKALQGMTRQISNTGACLPNPTDHFSPKRDRLTLAYVDLRGRFCPIDTKVIMSFYTRRGNRTDELRQDITCQDGGSQSRLLASAPRGGLDLSFRYLDKGGAFTTNRASIKAVQLDLELQTGKVSTRLQRTKLQSIRVQCVNL